MKKLAKIFSISLILLSITACTNNNTDKENTISYHLDINKTYKEKIDFILEKDAYTKVKEEENEEMNATSLEFELLKDNPEPIFSNHNTKYKKKIKNNSSNIKVTLSYNYLETEFMYAQYITQCFENYKFTNNKKYFQINLSGEFYCLNDKELTITVSTPYDNETKTGSCDDDTCTWEINQNNQKSTNIDLKIYRNRNNMKTNHSVPITNIIKIIFIILLIIILILLIIKLKKRKKIEQNPYLQ